MKIRKLIKMKNNENSKKIAKNNFIICYSDYKDTFKKNLATNVFFIFINLDKLEDLPHAS